jgi:fructan beta-fructosidase
MKTKPIDLLLLPFALLMTLAPGQPLRAADPAPSATPSPAPAPLLVPVEKTLAVDGSHLIVPVGNYEGKTNQILLGIYDGPKLVQNFTVSLPHGNDPFWLAAYPLDHFSLKGKQIKITTVDGKGVPEGCRESFEKIRVGAASDVLAATDYTQPYRNQFHASTRRGWNNDPNGMVFHDGTYHLYYQYNPFGIFWGNMHWGHLESTDLVHWEEKPIAFYQDTVKNMAFSGGGFIDSNNSSGLGTNTQFAALTRTGEGGECLAYSKDGGETFTEWQENPVVKHHGRDPKIIWYQPEQKWVMAAYDNDPLPETDAIPRTNGDEKSAHNKIAFWESKDLRHWTRTGAFSDPDRMAVFECPEMFQIPVQGKPGESRWILMAAQNRYFIGQFDGKTFHKDKGDKEGEAGPFGTKHGAFYAAQTFSDLPDGRRIQIGWLQTDHYLKQFPNQIDNQGFTIPHELTLRETKDGLRLFYYPVKEMELLRGDLLAEGKDLTVAQANDLLQKCKGELSEVLIEFSGEGPKQFLINGIDAGFTGRSARIFTDRTVNEVFADDGLSYEIRRRPGNKFDSTETRLTLPAGAEERIRSLKIYRLKSIWPG